jgi:hypothetical protein
MPRNSSGTYTLPLPPVVSGEVIEADWANESLADLAQALTDSLDRLGRGGMLAPFFVPDGSAAAPGLGFTNEPTTGIYRTSTGTFGIATAGVSRATFNANGMAATALTLSGPISIDTQAATKKYVDDAVAAGGGSPALPLTGGVMSGTIRFSEVTTPLRFFLGAADIGNLTVTPTMLQLWSGGEFMSFSNSGVLAALDISAGHDINAVNDIYAQRWIGVGTTGALMFVATDPEFGPYLGWRSSIGGSGLTLFDNGYCASAGYRALNELVSLGIVTAHNSGVKWRSGTIIGSGRYMDTRVNPADGALVWYNESNTPIFWINQDGTFGSAGIASIAGTPVP